MMPKRFESSDCDEVMRQPGERHERSCPYAEITRTHFEANAKVYDTGRAGERTNFWVDEILRQARPAPGVCYLDLGCGTGIIATALARSVSCSGAAVIGIDPSRSMLDQAKAKDGSDLVTWIQGRAEEIPLDDCSVDVVFISQALHHFEDKKRASEEVFRVLRPGGGLMIRTFSHEQLRSRQTFAFFPEMLKSQLERYPDIPELKSMLIEIGFVAPLESVHCWEDSMPPSWWIYAAENRIYSMYSHLSDEEIARGIDRVRKHIRTHGESPLRADDVNTLVTANKPRR